jgi:hypothetical protein
MTYRFHPAAEAEHLGQIAFYEPRRKGLGGRYRDHFLKIIQGGLRAAGAISDRAAARYSAGTPPTISFDAHLS